MRQGNLFFEEMAYQRLDKGKDPLVTLAETVDWHIFEEPLRVFRESLRTTDSPAGRKPFDPLLMFKILVLQSLYNLSDDAMEYQIRDRLSFQRFCDLSLEDRVPDAKTLWLFREQLTQAGLVELLFARFDEALRQMGLEARKGQIVDASLVSVPIQRNGREENRQIREGNPPQEWSEAKSRQKDTEARWTVKNGKSTFGYKNHIEADVSCKLIRRYAVTPASVHDSQVFKELLDPGNTSKDVWADAAYRSASHLEYLRQEGYREHIQRKGTSGHPLTGWEKQGNRTRSRTRSRVEHIFAAQKQQAGTLLLRSIGLARAKARIGLRNLIYNLQRFTYLVTQVYVWA